MISVLELGLLDYATALHLQQELVALRKQDLIPDTLLLLEHPPVITLGRNARAANILASSQVLAERGVEVFECDRGGDVTFHGPGQLVAYPIFDLRSFPSPTASRKTLGAVEFVRSLEEVLIGTCAGFGIAAGRIPGLTGVWVNQPETGAVEAKIAAIGVHISRGVTSHGFALNVNTDLTYFNLIVPCGITSRPVTTMREQLRRQVPLPDVAATVILRFAEVFHVPVVRVESLEVLMENSVGVPMRPPARLRELRGEEETFWA